MVSKAEKEASRTLRELLFGLPDGGAIPEGDSYRWALTALEWFVPEVLQEIHRDWRFEGLDGLYPALAQRTNETEVEIFGLCCIISDQTLTPIHLRLQLAESAEEVSWLECRLGERGPNGMAKSPYSSLNSAMRRMHALSGNADLVDWVYTATYGERRVAVRE